MNKAARYLRRRPILAVGVIAFGIAVIANSAFHLIDPNPNAKKGQYHG
jgi:hypothetical protein